MTPPPTDKLEAETRKEIDAKLEAAGCIVQDKKELNLFESLVWPCSKWTWAPARYELLKKPRQMWRRFH